MSIRNTPARESAANSLAAQSSSGEPDSIANLSPIVWLTCLHLLAATVGHAQDRYPPFNTRVGTQAFNPKYTFSTTETQLVEMARCIHEMGSDIFKFRLAPDAGDTGTFGTLREIAERDPSCRKVFAMPFRWYLLWAYPVRKHGDDNSWRDGLSPAESQAEYDQLYDLTRYLLRAYRGTGKTFLLGHWEGDWSLLGSYRAEDEPTTVAIQGMTNWYRIRQKAVDDARRDEPLSDVQVLHYAEVNLVAKSLTGAKSVTTSVLPSSPVDLVSYSAYDGLGAPFPETLFSCLEAITTSAQTRGPFSRNVFVGEYGFPLLGGKLTPEEQGDRTKQTIKAAAGWGAPFVLYWQLYDNESGDSGRGFWLIDNLNRKQPAWFVHRSFLARAHTFKNFYRYWLRRNPTDAEFYRFAGEFDTFSTSAELDRILDSPEFAQRLTNSEYAAFLAIRLLDNPRIPSSPAGAVRELSGLLDSGTSRSRVLNQILDSPEFEERVSTGTFIRQVVTNALHGSPSPVNSAMEAELSRLAGAGQPRSELWRTLLDSDLFHLAELSLRLIDEKGSEVIERKHFFSGKDD